MWLSRRPLAWAAVYFILGMSLSAKPELPALWVLAGMAGILLPAGCLRRALTLRRTVLLLAAAAAGAGYGVWSFGTSDGTMLASLASNGTPLRLVGLAADSAQVDGNRAEFHVRTIQIGPVNGGGQQRVSGRMLVRVKLLRQAGQRKASEWHAGERVTVTGELERPMQARNFGAFNYRDYLGNQGIHWIFSVKGSGSVQVSRTSFNRYWFGIWPHRIRQSLGNEVDRLYNPRQAGIMKSLLLGLRQDLDKRDSQAFSLIGISHVLAISGLHVGIILGAVLGLLKLLRVRRERLLNTGMLILPAFVLMTGGSPSVLRAGLTAGFALYAAKKHKLKDGMNLLGAAAVIVLIFEPRDLFSVSFQLSFLITAGLLIAVPLVNKLLPMRNRMIGSMLSVALTAQIVSFPLTVYYFHQYSLWSFAANLLLVPIFSLAVLPGGYLSLIFDPVMHRLGLTWGLSSVIGHVNQFLLQGVYAMDAWKRMNLTWPKVPLMWVIAYYALAGWLLYAGANWAEERRERSKAAAAPESNPNLEIGRTDKTRRSGFSRPERESGTPVDERITEPLRASAFSSPYRAHGVQPVEANAASAAPIANPKWRNSDGKGRSAERRKKWTRPFACTCGVLFFLLFLLIGYIGYGPDNADWVPDRLELGAVPPADVDFMDVGQGDCIFIRFPSGRTMLVDGGGTLNFYGKGQAWKKRKNPFEAGRDVVVPELKMLGVHQLDDVISSHEDWDHLGGFAAVFRQIPAKRFWFNGTIKESASAEKVLQAIDRDNVPMYEAQAGRKVRMGPHAELQFLYPFTREGQILLDAKHNQNAHCVVFVLNIYGRTLLFTGDMDAASEQAVLREVRTWPASRRIWHGGVDVLKVAHHGSKTATTEAWLNYWQPRTAVISVGAHNLYGHPSPQVVDRLQQHGIRIYRTDRDGEVELRISPRQMTVRTKLSPAS